MSMASDPKLRPPHLRRSWLFVPGLDRQRHRQALEVRADVVVADLEEFTKADERPQAYVAIQDLMAECRQSGVVGAVRVNQLGRGGKEDLRGVMPSAPAAIFLPHVERAAQIIELDEEISKLEKAFSLAHGTTEIVPTLESARGVVNIQSILGASQRVTACLLAAEDLSASLDVVRGADAIELRHVRSRFQVDCTAADCVPIDCPFSYNDSNAIKADLAWARRIGLKARCTVYPQQVTYIHAAFSLSDAEQAAAIDVLRRFESGEKDCFGMTIDPPDYYTAMRLLSRQAQLSEWENKP
ncbi:HpcH/HpaI aldolase/citrate lyase family protein [Cupriavidus sp. H39]|uniref:HpcH/HpaI aldolase/citrate lyase family protein n=1 Tax=Cupriavidus sp. H39 TaxID=3401635 RepID=UPI003CFD5455